MRFDPTEFNLASREVLTRLALSEALVELLIQKGVFSREEWAWREAACREDVERRLEKVQEHDPSVVEAPTRDLG